MRIQRVSSKWAKTKVILQNRLLAVYVPDTRKYSAKGLYELLDLYSTAYIKPDRGTYGIGVMRAERRTVHLQPSVKQDSPAGAAEAAQPESEPVPKEMFILRYALDSEAFGTREELHKAIKRRIGNKTYLVQQGIELLKHQDRPFDLRVLAQKTPGGAWESTGMLGRVAAPQKVITNYHSGGSVYFLDELLKPHMTPSEKADTMQQLRAMGVKIAAQLETAYPKLKEIGLDVAVDEHHDLWLLEVNTLPAISVFKMCPDKSVYRRIHRYAVAYGRLKKKKGTGTARRKTAARA